MRLLYAEDEGAMADAVADILTFHNYKVEVVDNGEDALACAREGGYDGIILDIMLPKMDGLAVLREVRRMGDSTPVLLLTARSDVADRIEGLDLGADDYLTKPFVMDELLARIRAMLRRRETYTPDILSAGDLSLDPGRVTLSHGDRSVSLQNKEFQLMETLMKNPNVCLSVDTLIMSAWGYDADADANSLRVYLSGLRKHLAKIGSSVEIKSRRNIGYMLLC